MLPVTTCPPHETIEILLLKQLNVTFLEAIVWDTLTDWPQFTQ